MADGPTDVAAQAAGATAPATAGLACTSPSGSASDRHLRGAVAPYPIALAGWAVLSTPAGGTAGHGGRRAQQPCARWWRSPSPVARAPGRRPGGGSTPASPSWWFHRAGSGTAATSPDPGMTQTRSSVQPVPLPPVLPGVIAVVLYVVDAYGSETALRVKAVHRGGGRGGGFHTAAAPATWSGHRRCSPRRRGGRGLGRNAGWPRRFRRPGLASSLFVAGAVLLLAGTVRAAGQVDGGDVRRHRRPGEVRRPGRRRDLPVLVVACRTTGAAVPAPMVVGTAVVGWQVVVGVVGAVPDERGDWGQLVHLLDSDREVHPAPTTTVGHLAGELGRSWPSPRSHDRDRPAPRPLGWDRLRAPETLTLLAVASLVPRRSLSSSLSPWRTRTCCL